MRKRSRTFGRLLAPTALAAFGVALAFVVTNSNPPDEGPTTAGRAAQESDLGTADTGTGARRSRDGRLPEGCYVVRAGDTLAGIGERTGLNVDRLQELNPDVDAQALVSGQRLNLREDGCD